VRLSREEWARLPADSSFALSEDDLRQIGGHLSREEATEIFLPLSRLLYLHVDATRSLYRAARAFLAEEDKEVPYVLGIAGSVAAGKSTVARVMRAERAPEEAVRASRGGPEPPTQAIEKPGRALEGEGFRVRPA